MTGPKDKPWNAMVFFTSPKPSFLNIQTSGNETTKYIVKLEVFWNSSLPNNYPRKEGMAGICIVSQYLY